MSGKSIKYKLGKLLTMVGVALCMFACAGQTDDSSDKSIVLSVDRTAIDANGRDQAVFKVEQTGVDITSKADIRCVSGDAEVVQGVFATQTPGKYIFEAVYEGAVSNQITITAAEVKASRFMRQSCVIEFTASSCTNCPDGFRKLNVLLDDFDGNAHLMAFHPLEYNGHEDVMGIPQTQELMNKYKITAYPMVLVDMRESSDLNNSNKLTSVIERSFNEYPAHCGVSIKSTYAQGHADVAVKVFSEKAAEYRLALYIVEDGVRGYQLDGSLNVDDYLHRHVVRKMVSSSIEGEKLGNIAIDSEVEKVWKVDLDPSWNIDNLYFYALAIDANGNINNMNICKVDNGMADYIYAK